MDKCCKHCGGTTFYVKEVGPHKGLYCRGCNRWQKWLSPREAMAYKQTAKSDVLKCHDCDWPTDNDAPPICKFGYSSCAFLGTDLCDTCVDGKIL